MESNKESNMESNKGVSVSYHTRLPVASSTGIVLTNYANELIMTREESISTIVDLAKKHKIDITELFDELIDNK